MVINSSVAIIAPVPNKATTLLMLSHHQRVQTEPEHLLLASGEETEDVARGDDRSEGSEPQRLCACRGKHRGAGEKVGKQELRQLHGVPSVDVAHG